MSNPSVSLDDWLSLGQSVEQYPQIFKSEHSARHLLKNRAENGLDDAVRIVGGRYLIHKARFAAWIDSRTAPRPGGRRAA